MQRICVFCGSKTGTSDVYQRAAEALGAAIVSRGYALVYGGGSVGLMGVIANAVLKAGGEVIGVIPEMLATKELLHPGVQSMHVTSSMHSRKALMEELSDAFIAMPGGYGTLEELLETITWAQLGIHRKPVGLLDVMGYFNPLVRLFDHAVAEGFIRPKHRDLVVVASEPDHLLDQLAHHKQPVERKWASLDET